MEQEAPQGKPRQVRKGNRKKIMQAALQLVSQDESGLSGLSIRRITKQAALSPPAFYNHFESVEALGLALVEEVGGTVKTVLRAVRQSAFDDALDEDAIISQSIIAAFDYIRSEDAIFTFVSRERAGTSAKIRAAIRREVAEIVDEMTTDFDQLARFEHFNFMELRSLVSAILAIGLNLIPDLLDKQQESERAAEDMLANFDFQVRLMTRTPAQAEKLKP